MARTKAQVTTATEEAPVEAPKAGAEEIELSEEAKPLKGVAKLEEEGDIAADYLEALLDIADLDGDIDIDV